MKLNFFKDILIYFFDKNKVIGIILLVPIILLLFLNL